MAKKGKAVNRRKSSGGRPPYVALLVVLAVIVVVVLLLEQTRKKVSVPEQKKVETPLHLKMPERTAPAQQPMSTAVAAPEKKEPVEPAPRPHGSGTVAIIIDDMGTNVSEVRELLAIGQPLTFSVIPSLAKAKAVAEIAHSAGAEVMVHMPMEPQGYPKQRMEKIGLLLSMDDAEVAQRVKGYFQTVPFAVGANNHMGSRFTEDAGKMETVLTVLKERGMFFIDSRTSPASVGLETARELGVKTAARQVFLDNVQDDALIRKQLQQAVSIARKRGSAIAICHPHPATIRALRGALPGIAREGITFVHVSKLVR
ncbi:divergent polysaccharide deacetylase family protein [Geomesophilobacter sediminis]|uniref:Divergent polysaccharide deacetylase family protein n=1 Tax=Geomesophilobacter sediminis TaxID=2798584 RepID=A0A8J7JMZ7_9BACT|nr:divergent polysaccharide deacetylase family protein [Geomesophilobacter sediminis]MBJ6726305.1 divergent polysaccharide deacetylase family protein [Geomesophilobacter sediminis]